MGNKRKGEVQMRLLWLWLVKIMPTSSRQGQPVWRLNYREQLSVPRHASTMVWDKEFDPVEAIYLKNKINRLGEMMKAIRMPTEKLWNQ